MNKQNKQLYLIKRLIESYQLLPHPEGGFYKENYRSTELIPLNALPVRFNGDRLLSTAIYFMILKGNFSAFHQIKSDECWHFYEGSSLWVHVLHPAQGYQLIKLGPNLEAGEVYQAVVPAGAWFASETNGAFAFVGCTVAPGFDFADFKLANASDLIKIYPQHISIISRLCR